MMRPFDNPLPKGYSEWERVKEEAECYYEGSEIGDIQVGLLETIDQMLGISMDVEAAALWQVVGSITVDGLMTERLSGDQSGWNSQVNINLARLSIRRGHKFPFEDEEWWPPTRSEDFFKSPMQTPCSRCGMYLYTNGGMDDCKGGKDG